VNKESRHPPSARVIRVDVYESGGHRRVDRVPCIIGEHLKFSTEELSSYFFTKWEHVVFDALLVAAAVEFCDRLKKRPVHHWRREFEVRIPVHDPYRWKQEKVTNALSNAVSFLTGDGWKFEFIARKRSQPTPMQSTFQMPGDACAIMPFSDGMDSRAVSGLMSRLIGDKLIRVRLGNKVKDAHTLTSNRHPFTAVPYNVRVNGSSGESSARSRGFKFATISGISAYVAKASQIIVPESGQGALGPVLVPVGQAYEDYRNHPLFTDRMEKYFSALLDYSPKFEFPRLWHTKGETLNEFVRLCVDREMWKETRSCWQSSRQVSVDGLRRQCGVCAACMLRRQSVHAAGLIESKDTYVWDNLSANSFEKGAAKAFDGLTAALREYGIAGVLHLKHLAELNSSKFGATVVETSGFHLSRSRNLSASEVKERLTRLLQQHQREWNEFLASLDKKSFICKWVEQR